MKKNTADSISFVRMIGANLKFLRLNRQTFMPQKVVAAALDITHQQVNKYETGKNTPCAYRLKQLADFFGVTCNDLVDPSYIVKNTKNHEVLDRGFDAAKYEQFDDEYPPGSGGLEHDPKMRATYDAILEDK
tara:strand:- start:14 stop:409 length:396 start_codon:yes stop_codon:yes gene_type:complete